jgi:succinate dehydrogenase / fumarate reductase cytochrome b subunit
MEMTKKKQSWEQGLVRMLGNLPGLSCYVKSRGWPFLLSWAHRITGAVLVLYLVVHLYTLYALMTPGEYAAAMAFYKNAVFSFLEWGIAVPLIFHTLNGSRLILYELFHVRNEEIMIQWVTIVGITYVGILAYVMVAQNQQVSYEIFWLISCVLSCMAGCVVLRKALKTSNPALWKLQRVSGAFLLPLASAHMFFMHVNYLAGHDAATVLLRMQSYFTKGVDLVFLALILFHSTYGLCGVISDYVQNDPVRRLSSGLTIAIMGICALAGLRLIIST